MQTLRELREHADGRLYARDHRAALHAYATIIQVSPNDLGARLRVADTLLALGEAQGAAYVYTMLARHAANAGYPYLALVCIKVLEALEPELGKLQSELAAIYGKGSPRVGRGARMSLAHPQTSLPPIRLDVPPPLEELAPAAAQLATDTRRIAAYPEQVPPVPIFSELPPEAFARVLGVLTLVRKRPGDVIVTQGDAGDAFYVLARGQVKVTRVDDEGTAHELATLGEGSIFGEMALVSAQPRSATVTALTDADLLRMDVGALRGIAGELDTIGAALSSYTRERLLQNLMATSRLFRPLDRKQRVDLLRRFKAVDVKAGTSLIVEGQKGRGLYVLLQGEVDVWTRDEEGDRLVLAQLEAGAVFGEIALLHDQAAMASVTAGVDTTVLFLARELFQKLVDAVDAIREHLEELGDERLMDTRISLTNPDVEELDIEELDLDELMIV